MKINTKTEHIHYHPPFHPFQGMCDSSCSSWTAHLWLLISCSNAGKSPQTVVQSKKNLSVVLLLLSAFVKVTHKGDQYERVSTIIGRLKIN